MYGCILHKCTCIYGMCCYVLTCINTHQSHAKVAHVQVRCFQINACINTYAYIRTRTCMHTCMKEMKILSSPSTRTGSLRPNKGPSWKRSLPASLRSDSLVETCMYVCMYVYVCRPKLENKFASFLEERSALATTLGLNTYVHACIHTWISFPDLHEF